MIKKYCVALIALFGLLIGGCTSSPLTPTDRQAYVANVVEDSLSIALVPVLTNNASYIPAARSIAAALGTFSGDTITPADVDAFLARTSIEPDDARTIAGVINAAWDTYQLRYSDEVSESVRPDVKLFLRAVSNGIHRAIAAVPPST